MCQVRPCFQHRWVAAALLPRCSSSSGALHPWPSSLCCHHPPRAHAHLLQALLRAGYRPTVYNSIELQVGMRCAGLGMCPLPLSPNCIRLIPDAAFLLQTSLM